MDFVPLPERVQKQEALLTQVLSTAAAPTAAASRMHWQCFALTSASCLQSLQAGQGYSSS